MKKKVLFIVLFLVFAVVVSGCSINLKKAKTLNQEQAKTRITEFINKNLMSNGETAEVKDFVLENGLYKMSVSLPNGQTIDAYMTKDGSKFFPQVMDLAKIEAEAAGGDTEETQVPVANAPKSHKPVVEVFVMSHCPYGTQIEKGIIPVAETLKDKIDFKIKFCDYAMHGEVELKEQLKQYCIAKEQSAKYFAYLKCFLNSGDSDACSKTANIKSVESCISKSDAEFSITKNFNDKSTWMGDYPTFNIHKDENTKYGVQGSPTLVINGAQVESGRDSKSLLATICTAFNNAPEECSTELSSASPAPGFGSGTTNASTDASCE